MKRLIGVLVVLLLMIVFTPSVVFAEESNIIDSGTCGVDGDNLAWVLTEEGKLTISGSGRMSNYSRHSVPWYEYKSDIISIEIADTVTSIGDYAFNNCSELKCVTIGSGVTCIGASAFRECSSLPSIVIPDKIVEIGEYAFQDCGSLKSAILPDNMTIISACAFYNCGNLISITVPNGVTQIEKNAFYGCNYLFNIHYEGTLGEWDSIVIESGNSYLRDPYIYYNSTGSKITWSYTEGVLTIGGSGAIERYPQATYRDVRPWKEYANEVTKIVIEEGVTSIGGFAFGDCDNLVSVLLPNSLTSIGSHAFYDCDNLTSVEIPDKVMDIGTYAFNSCNKLSKVTFGKNVTNIYERAFSGCINFDYNNNLILQFKGNAPTIHKDAYQDGCVLAYYPRSNTSWIEFIKQDSSYTSWVGVPLVAPINFQVKSIDHDYSTVEIDWSDVSGATGYEVCCKNKNGYYYLNTKTPGVCDTSVLTDTTYKVRAYIKINDNIEYGDYSSEISVKVLPEAPINVKAASAGYSSIKISWDPVDGADGYAVYRYSSDTGKYGYVSSTTKTSMTNSSRTTGKTYYYKVRAYRTVDGVKKYGDYSSSVSAKAVPAAPTNVKAESAGYSSIKISWDKVSGATGYAVYRYSSDTKKYSYIGYTTKLSYTNGSRTTGKTYYYKVRAYRTVDDVKKYGDYSSSVSTKAVPATPKNVKAASAGYSSIKISWDKVSGATGYAVYRYSSDTKKYSYIGYTTKLSYTNGSRTTGKTYYYKVRAYRTVDDVKKYGSYSSSVSAKAIPATPSITAANAGSGKIKVSWGKISGASGYEVYRATSSGGTYSKVTTVTSGSTLSYTNSGLTKGKTYYYKVRAYRTVDGVKKYGNYSTVKYAKG